MEELFGPQEAKQIFEEEKEEEKEEEEEEESDSDEEERNCCDRHYTNPLDAPLERCLFQQALRMQ